MPNYTGTFKASVHVMFANISSVKANHNGQKPNISEVGNVLLFLQWKILQCFMAKNVAYD